jgi:hypothetical protein
VSAPPGLPTDRHPVLPALLFSVMAFAAVQSAGAAPVERLSGVYRQRAVEVATVGDRLVIVTRMTRFTRCGTRRPLAEDLNDHVVEVLGTEVPGVGFVAGIINAVEGCELPSGRPRPGAAAGPRL